MLLTIILILVGYAILIKGADFLVEGASSSAKQYNISNIAIGLTVVSLGTSTPELVVSLLAALNDQNDASFGNVIGSNNFNLLLILGVSGVIYPLSVLRNTVIYEIPISLLAAMILFLLVNDIPLIKGDAARLSRGDSVLMLLFFLAFLFYVYRTMRTISNPGNEPEIKLHSFKVSLGLILLGIAMLVGGGKLVVDNATTIAQHFGLSEKLIGLTILAAGTSLPELATSAVAAYRKNTDIAIGNVVGSNIFNIFFILGVTGLINPIAYNPALNFDLYVLMLSTVLLMVFMFTLKKRRLDRAESIVFLAVYIGYTIYLIGTD